MDEPDGPKERDRLAELLRRARRTEEPGGQEQVEETLRWLLQLGMPERPASRRLRERVRSLAVVPRPRGGGALTHLLARLWPWCRALRPGERHRAPHPHAGTRPRELTPTERERLALLLAADVRQLPESRALRAAARQLAPRLLALLPEPEREALLLRLRHGLSPAEIARVLGRSDGDTHELLRRAQDTIVGQAEGDRGP